MHALANKVKKCFEDSMRFIPVDVRIPHLEQMSCKAAASISSLIRTSTLYRMTQKAILHLTNSLVDVRIWSLDIYCSFAFKNELLNIDIQTSVAEKFLAGLSLSNRDILVCSYVSVTIWNDLFLPSEKICLLWYSL